MREQFNPLQIASLDDIKIVDEDEAIYEPPKGAVSAAKKALEWRDKHGDDVKGGTQVGWTRASQLASGDKVSADIVRRMYQFFSRHEGNQSVAKEYQDEPWKDAGYVSWLLWGGDAGKSWAERTWDSISSKDEAKAKKCWKGYKRVAGKKAGEKGSCVKESRASIVTERFIAAYEDFDYDKYSRSSEYVKDQIEASKDTIKDLTDKMRDATDSEKKKLKDRIDRHKERLNQYNRMLRKIDNKK
jgi:hypothetical protein